METDEYKYLFKILPTYAWDMSIYQLNEWRNEIIAYEMKGGIVGYKNTIDQAIRMKKRHEIGLWLFVGGIALITITLFILSIN